MKNTVKYWFGPLFHLFFPRCCAVCGASLIEGEDTICTHCNIDMPRTNYHKMKDNPVERMFWGKFPLERATSYFFEDAAKNATTFPIEVSEKARNFYGALGYAADAYGNNSVQFYIVSNKTPADTSKISAEKVQAKADELASKLANESVAEHSGRDSRNRRSRRNRQLRHQASNT